MNYDHWLERWLSLLKDAGKTVLDVGCGPGYDTHALTSWGFSVIASDISTVALARSKERNPEVEHIQADARTLEPVANGSFDVVVACLSLHYFDVDGTHCAFQAVRRVLRDDGIFVFRVNAFDDYEFGAQANLRPWELTTYDEKQKQFFTRGMLNEVLVERFDILEMRKTTTMRYVKPKSVFECVAQKSSVARGSNEA